VGIGRPVSYGHQSGIGVTLVDGAARFSCQRLLALTLDKEERRNRETLVMGEKAIALMMTMALCYIMRPNVSTKAIAMFTESAELYDLVYSSFKDYSAEARRSDASCARSPRLQNRAGRPLRHGEHAASCGHHGFVVAGSISIRIRSDRPQKASCRPVYQAVWSISTSPAIRRHRLSFSSIGYLARWIA